MVLLGAVSSASMTSPIAPHSLASLFGSRFSAHTETADLRSLPTTLRGNQPVNSRQREHRALCASAIRITQLDQLPGSPK
jgi:uncharacterized protein (TIGR03437 family)